MALCPHEPLDLCARIGELLQCVHEVASAFRSADSVYEVVPVDRREGSASVNQRLDS